ncbi:nucleoid-structuring protein H-NS [Dawidia soli]|uniref:Nucleoid-structuring protein H-NS n=1 Tax=Dawidia soli TaxID=2782352 RepID=A0AAP2D5W0_9BACT|nr:nucleoid-structuring protein H-NS [Dawidia soli]MBT1685914.1 nucleoid-structuring protein H-NS [Dawidia soli]
MTLLIQRSSRFIMLAVMVVVLAMGAGCKGKKKAMEAQAAAEKARMEQEAAARKQREEEEARRRREAEEQARRDAEARTRAEREVGPQKKLEQYFSAIANASSPGAANNSINEALALFASPSTPVLIVIHEEGGEKDYDRPTNIKDYLNYLKDQRKPADRIGNLQFDGSGKIKEVELVKQK